MAKLPDSLAPFVTRSISNSTKAKLTPRSSNGSPPMDIPGLTTTTFINGTTAASRIGSTSAPNSETSARWPWMSPNETKAAKPARPPARGTNLIFQTLLDLKPAKLIKRLDRKPEHITSLLNTFTRLNR